VIIAVVFVVVLVYVVSLSVRISRGFSRSLESPEHVVRLQILNGCGENGLAARVADALADYAKGDLEIRVVDTDNFELSPVEKSFVIARTEDNLSAVLLAKQLGLAPGEVAYKPLENNYRQVTATLVLGSDWSAVEPLNSLIMEK